MVSTPKRSTHGGGGVHNACMKKILIVNAGSASKKYAVYDGETELFRAHFERGKNGFVVTEYVSGAHETRTITGDEYRGSAQRFLDDSIARGIMQKEDCAVIGFRVVAPGDYFNTVRIIDAAYREKLGAAYAIAPLHVRAVMDEIDAFSACMPQIPRIGVSDSAFHVTIPERARLYALPIEDSTALGIYRYGYHGISLRSALEALERLMGAVPERVIVCHLGSGASVTAIQHGASIDTSMGFTPLEGLVMATRVGDIDAGALIHLGKTKGLSYDELDEYCNHACGLRGLSGGSEGGVRELLEREAAGDAAAVRALDLFSYRIKKYIGAYYAALGGCDALVFTGTTGERAPRIRARVCEGLAAFGIVVDDAKNRALTGDADGHIEHDNALVNISVVCADEMRQIAKEAMMFL